MSLMRTCTKCFLQKAIEEFPWKYKALGKRHTVCKECTAKRSNDWYQDNRDSHIQNVMENKTADRIRARQFAFDYLSTHPCVLCGETDPVVLEFDHIRGKKADIARLNTEFDMWLPAIRVRRDTCKSYERKEKTRWYLRELERQERVENKKK